jgi:cell wall-associated NlpC family hydrolase
VKSIATTRPGDLAFFKNESGNINHVGMVIEERRIIHSSGKVRIDKLTEDGILNADTKTITHPFAHARRILPE